MAASKLPRAVSGGTVAFSKSMGANGGSSLVIRELVTAATTSSYKALTKTIPPNCRVDAIHIRTTTTVTQSTGTHIGLGTGSGSDPDQFVEVAFASLDAVNDYIIQAPDVATLTTTETTVYVASLNGSGAASGDITAGVLDITIFCTEYPISVAV